MDETTTTILDAATAVFGQHGFSGASMRAIADAAGVSRPTVYARYKNKEAVYRAVYERTFAQALDGVRAALGRSAPLSERLGAALDAFFGRLVSEVKALEQSQELLSHQEQLAGDIVQQATAALHAALLAAVEEPGGALPPGVSHAALVELMLMAPRGLKDPERDLARFRARLDLLARLVAHAVGAP